MYQRSRTSTPLFIVLSILSASWSSVALARRPQTPTATMTATPTLTPTRHARQGGTHAHCNRDSDAHR